MTTLFIPRGAFGLPCGSKKQSKKNMDAFVKDLGVDAKYKFIEADRGWHWYKLKYGKRKHTVGMPALPLEEVRYLNLEGQKIGHYARLVVDGGTWAWYFALRQCFNEEEGA